MADLIDQLVETAMCDLFWRPDHMQVVTRAEIQYTHSAHPSRRFNNVVRVQPGLADYGQLIDEVLHAHAGKNSEWRLGLPSQSERLEKAIYNAGYSRTDPCDVCSTATDAARPPMPEDIRVSRVCDLEGYRDTLTVMAGAFERFDMPSEAEMRHNLERLVGSEARSHRYVAYDALNGDPLSTGALNLFPDLKLGFMWGGSTVSAARGRGIYSALVTSRMAAARAWGLERIALYAMEGTSAPIVEAQGFKMHGSIHFWERPLPAE